MTRGLVLGKFMPPTRGHQYLIDMAAAYADEVSVLVCSLPTEPIPGALRFGWLKEHYAGRPNVRIIDHTRIVPQEPAEHPDFWAIWRQTILDHLGFLPDLVFASEPYGKPLADVLGARFIPVDIDRQEVPISATRVRAAPIAHWQLILPEARPYFLKRVVVFGPESTGKSTLANRLADAYDTRHVSEYIRKIQDLTGIAPGTDGLHMHARGHLASEEAMARQANRVLFLDTDLLTTTIWARWLEQPCPGWIEEQARRRRYDLTLLMNIDCPWVDDGTRYFGDPATRRRFFDDCERTLSDAGRPYIIVSGATWGERYRVACAQVDALLKAPIDSSDLPIAQAIVNA